MQKTEERRICNCCGKELKQYEEYVNIGQRWGYFSKKDGIYQKGIICEDCFTRITGDFQIPLEEEEITELL